MYRPLLIRWQSELTNNSTARNLHYHSFGWFPVLHKDHMCLADGLDGMNLSSLRSLIAPHRLSVIGHFGHAILMSHKDMPISHQHGIADFATFQLVQITPTYQSVLDDEHATLLALPCIKEIVPGKTIIHWFLC